MNWQSIAVIIIVSLAAASLLRRIVRIFRSRSRRSCGSCSSCSGESAGAKVLPLVSLSLGGSDPSRSDRNVPEHTLDSIAQSKE